jgi:hypothetical protein
MCYLSKQNTTFQLDVLVFEEELHIETIQHNYKTSLKKSYFSK